MKTFLVISLFLLPLCLSAQGWKPTPQKAAGWGVMFLAGAAYGLRERLHQNPARFGEGTGFWEAGSWKRKYRDWDGGDMREPYPGAQSALVFTTDAWHFLGAASRTMLVTGTVIVMTGEHRPFWHYALDAAIGLAANGVGAHIAFELAR